MYLLFLDESGAAGDRRFAVGGITVAAADWELLRARWRAALERHGWHDAPEPKWHGIRTGGVPPALADDLFAAVAGAPVTCFVCVLRMRAARRDGVSLLADAESAYTTAVTFLAERYQAFLADHDASGAVVLDSRDPDADDRLRRFFGRLVRSGTAYRELDRIVDGIFLTPSHHSLGLQVADLVVGATLAAEQGRLGDATRWRDALWPRFARHPATGAVEGVGLKVFPARHGAADASPRKLFATGPRDRRRSPTA